MNLDECRVTIVGLGLMGGSLAAALRGCVRSIVGTDSSPDPIERAPGLGVVDEATHDLAQALDGCDLAVLAVPVRASLQIIAKLGVDLPPPARLMDLASTKVDVVRAMQGLPSSIDPIGGHPLCGKETAGLESADRKLFEGARFALVPLERTSPELLSLVEDLVRAIGAQPLRIGAAEHDRAAALTSQLPYLLAAALVCRVGRAEGDLPALRDLLASGFHDTSRLAASDVTMMLDILITNRENAITELQALLQVMEEQLDDLVYEREARLRRRLEWVQTMKFSLQPEQKGQS